MTTLTRILRNLLKVIKLFFAGESLEDINVWLHGIWLELQGEEENI